MMDQHMSDRIAHAIADDIIREKLPVGSRLPSLRELTTRHQVSYVTIHKALRKLQSERLITLRPGSGSYIAEGFNINAVNAAFSDHTLTSPRQRRIGVLLPVWVDKGGKTAVYDVIDSFCERCSSHDWRIELITPSIHEINSPVLSHKILAKHFDGFVWLTPLALHHWILEQISEQLDCMVVSERPFEKIGITTVHSDYYQLARDAVRLFTERGHRELMCFCGQYYDVWTDPYTDMMLDALRVAADEAGLKFDESCYRQVFPMPDREAEAIIRGYFADHPEKNAIFCMHNNRLPMIIAALKQHHPDLHDDAVTIVDNCYKSTPFYDDRVDGIGIYRVRYPNHLIGSAIAAVFERKWCNMLNEPEPLLNEIVPPGEKF